MKVQVQQPSNVDTAETSGHQGQQQLKPGVTETHLNAALLQRELF